MCLVSVSNHNHARALRLSQHVVVVVLRDALHAAPHVVDRRRARRRLGRDVERAELHRDRPRDDGGGYGGDGAAAAPTPFAGDGHEEEETHEADFNELNPAAEAAAREEAAARASARAAPVDHVRRGVQRVAQYDDDDML